MSLPPIIAWSDRIDAQGNLIGQPKPWGHSSPSQAKTFRRCQKKWYLEKIAGMGSTSTPATILGTNVHSWMEHIIKRRPVPPGVGPEWDRARRILEPALPFLPTNKNNVVCEVDYSIPTPFVPVIMRIDLIEPGREAPWMVTDLKTIGDMAYTLTEDELRMDVQCATYIKALTLQAPVDRAEFRHVYAQTGAPGAKERIVLVQRQEIEDRWQGMVETVARQKQTSLARNINDVPGNENACNDYGGCAFKANCPIGKSKGLFSFTQPKAPNASSLAALARRIDVETISVEASASPPSERSERGGIAGEKNETSALAWEIAAAWIVAARASGQEVSDEIYAIIERDVIPFLNDRARQLRP